jgi:hypothetical protein
MVIAAEIRIAPEAATVTEDPEGTDHRGAIADPASS